MSISVTAQAGLEIIQKLTTGELKIDGIIVRDAVTGRFRYILRGFENLSINLSDISPLGPLQSAMKVIRLSQIISISQNVIILVNLEKIDDRLKKIEERLKQIETAVDELKQISEFNRAMHIAEAVAKIKSAISSANIAFRDGDRTASILIGQRSEEGFYQILQMVDYLVKKEIDGMPIGLKNTSLTFDMCKNMADAAYVASAVWLALGDKCAAAKTLQEGVDKIAWMRKRFCAVFFDPELLLRRINLGSKPNQYLDVSGIL